MAIQGSTTGNLTRSSSVPSTSPGYTICFWVRITGTNASVYETPISINDLSTYMVLVMNQGGSDLYLQDSNVLNSQVYPGGTNTWFFVALTFTGTTARWLRRTESETSLTTSGNLTCVAHGGAGYTLHVLQESAGQKRAEHFQLYGLKIHDAVLSDAEIWEESVRLRPKRKANINTFCPFYTASGTDEGGRGLNLTTGGTLTTVGEQPRISRGGGAARYVLPPAAAAQTITLGGAVDEQENGPSPALSHGLTQGAGNEQEALDAPTVTLALAQGALDEQEQLSGPTLTLAVAQGALAEQESVASPTVTIGGTIAPSAASEPEVLDQPSIIAAAVITPSVADEQENGPGPTLHLSITEGALDEQEAPAAPTLHQALAQGGLDEQELLSQPLVGLPGPDQDVEFDDLLLDLSSDQPPSTIASGSWPDAMGTTRWRWTFTPDFASHEVPSGFAFLWNFEVADEYNQVWLEYTDACRLRAESTSGQICSRELSFAASEPITVEFDPSGGTVRISGASSGNGILAATSGAWTWPVDVPLHVGQTSTGAFPFAGAFSDVTSGTVGPAEEGDILDGPTLTVQVVGGLADEQEAPPAPVIAVGFEPTAATEQEASDPPLIVLDLRTGSTSQREVLDPPTIVTAVVVAALAETESVPSPSAGKGVSADPLAEQEALGAPVVGYGFTLLPAAIAEAEQLAGPRADLEVAVAALAEQEAIASMVVGDRAAPEPISEPEVLGSPSLIAAAVITGAAVVEAEVPPTPTLTQFLSAGIAQEGEALGQPAVVLVATPAAIAEAEQVFSPALVLRPLQQPLAEAEQLGAPTLHLAITQGALAEQEQVPAPIGFVLPAPLLEQETLGAPTTALVAAPGAISDGEQLGAPRLDQALAQGALGETEAPPTPVIASGLGQGVLLEQESLDAPALALGIGQGATSEQEQLGAPSATIVLAASALGEGESMGSPALTTSGAVSSAGVAEAEQLGAPRLDQAVAQGALVEPEQVLARGIGDFVDPQTIDEAEVFGALSLQYAFTAPLIDETESVAIPSLLGPINVGLIDKRDTAEIVRDKIAEILATEIVRQQAQAVTAGKDPNEWKLRIFLERSHPWAEFVDCPGTTENPAYPVPLVNVSLDSVSYDMSGSNVVERQKAIGIYHIDCYGYGVSADRAGGGHDAGDERAAMEAKRAVRLVRNILMAGTHTYLGMRGVVWRRWTQGVTVFQPQIDARPMQNVVAARIAFEVTFNEFSPQVEGVPLSLIAVNLRHGANGELLLHYDH